MQNPILGYQGLNWRPAFVPNGGQRLAQVQTQAPKEFLDDPAFLSFSDIVAFGVVGWITYTMYKADNPWMPFWLVATTAIGMKTLHDLSKTK